MNYIDIKKIEYKKNDKTIIKLKNFSIKKGDYISIYGKNGCGKSTLAFILAGLISDEKFEIYNNNIKIDSNFLKEKVGIIFQNFENQFFASIVENDIAFGLENKNIKSRYVMNEIIDKNLEKLSILNLKKRNINNLSGGEKQKVAIASVLSLEKEIIIFDEATSMLDQKNARIINDIILKLNKEEGKTIIVISHKEEEINSAKKIYKFENGTLIENDKFNNK